MFQFENCIKFILFLLTTTSASRFGYQFLRQGQETAPEPAEQAVDAPAYVADQSFLSRLLATKRGPVVVFLTPGSDLDLNLEALKGEAVELLEFVPNKEEKNAYVLYGLLSDALRSSDLDAEANQQLEHTRGVLRQSFRSRCRARRQCETQCKNVPKKQNSCEDVCQQKNDELNVCDEPAVDACASQGWDGCGEMRPTKRPNPAGKMRLYD